MKNPFLLYQNLLLTNNALNPNAIFVEGVNNITIFDGDISDVLVYDHTLTEQEYGMLSQRGDDFTTDGLVYSALVTDVVYEEYNANGDPLKIIMSDGTEMTYTWNALGNPIAVDVVLGDIVRKQARGVLIRLRSPLLIPPKRVMTRSWASESGSIAPPISGTHSSTP